MSQSPSLRAFADYLFNVSTFHFHKLYQRQRFFKSTQIKPSLRRPPFQRGYILPESGGVIVINTENQGPFNFFIIIFFYFIASIPVCLCFRLCVYVCVHVPNQAHLQTHRKGGKCPKRATALILFSVVHYYVYMPHIVYCIDN